MLFSAHCTDIIIFHPVKYKWASENESDMKLQLFRAQNLSMIHQHANVEKGWFQPHLNKISFPESKWTKVAYSNQGPIPFLADLTLSLRSGWIIGCFSGVSRRKNMVQKHPVSCKMHIGSEDRLWGCRKTPLVGQGCSFGPALCRWESPHFK